MRKIEFNSNDEVVAKYVSQIQKLYPMYLVNVNNVNDFALMHEEYKNCSNCKGLSECKNTNVGFSTRYENGEFCLRECKYKSELKAQNNKTSLIKTLYLPKNILDAKLENYDVNTDSRKKIYAQLISFISNYGTSKQKGLYLYGTFSIGKTYTLACIANELAKNNISSLLIYFPDLVSDLKNALGTPRFEELINMLKSIDVLMLDDIGSENMTPWLRDEIIGPILNYRVLEEKPIFISSNISPNEITAHFAIDKSPSSVLKAQRIVSRMTSLAYIVDMSDSSKYKR